ncbi:MAG: hypothetical protein AW11_03320 [Candidatus Accumulibacter regalis]|jgi:lysozyme|uniref:Uncharacterized protein n=1 Tax=Accumulibacter regalis TaxID=522306 RepID=A0A011PE52_ACCRE|nr:MAG: hypothetical protein AW11_03320 [Candidatus Accumulibacter regalis]
MEAGSFIAPIGSAGALNATLLYCPVLATEPEGRLAAIVDSRSTLTQGRFNSTLRRRISQRDWTNAARELRRWVYGAAKWLQISLGVEILKP